MSYKFLHFTISDRMTDGLERYVNNHLPPGGFLQAVISNDLAQAVERADGDNMANLPAFVAFLNNEAPSECWGSPERLKAWINDGNTHVPPETV